MEIKFFENLKVEKGNVLISKTGHIRFKKDVVKKYNIVKSDRFMIGYNTEETPINNLYFYKSDDDNGFMISYANNSYCMSIKSILLKSEIEYPVKARIDTWMHTLNLGDGNMKSIEGFVLTIHHKK